MVRYVENDGCGMPSKRPRGRPRKNSQPLGVPQFSTPTPSKRDAEALATWNTVKLLGVSSCNEEAVLAEIRKSKRLQLLEEDAQ